MDRNASFTLTGSAYTSVCAAQETLSQTAHLQYEWALFEGDTQLTHVQSISRNPLEFKLPPYTLRSGVLYRVVLHVTHSLSQTRASKGVDVVVYAGHISCPALGSASHLPLSFDKAVSVDASSCYDSNEGPAPTASDSAPTISTTAHLRYTFSCAKISPRYSPDCSLLHPSLGNGSAAPGPLAGPTPSPLRRYSVKEEDLLDANADVSLGDIYRIDVVVTSIQATDSRRARGAVYLLIQAPTAPSIRLTSLGGSRVNPSAKVKVVGTVDVVASGTLTWSVNDPSLQLAHTSLSPVVLPVMIPPGRLRGAVLSPFRLGVSLVLPPSSLQAGAVYVFSLRAQLSNNESSTAVITIAVNEAPLPGVLEVTPPSGELLATIFHLQAYQWFDTDVPLSYEFGYLSTADSHSTVIVRGRLEQLETRTQLPSGSVDNHYLLTCVVVVYDAMGASSRAAAAVTVAPGAQRVSAQTLTNLFLSSVQGGGPGDQQGSIAVTSSVLAMAECRSSPVCAGLNRRNCSVVTGTCGPCLEGFLGEPGHANSMCLSETTVGALSRRRRLSEEVLCMSNDDCRASGPFRVCSQHGKCVPAPKVCPGDCSGRGVCKYFSVYDLSEPLAANATCNVLDFKCRALCVCEEGAAGVACSSSPAEVAVTSSLRLLLLHGLRNMSRLENDDRDSLLARLVSVQLLVGDGTSLGEEITTEMLLLLLGILDSAEQHLLSSEDLAGIGVVLDGVAAGNHSVNGTLFAEVLARYSAYIMTDSVTGQNPISLATESFRITSTSTLDSGQSVVVAGALSHLEALGGKMAPRVTLPASSDVYKVTLTESVLAGRKSSNRADGGGVNSSHQLTIPVDMVLSQWPCSAEQRECSLEVVLRHELGEGLVTAPPGNVSGPASPPAMELQCIDGSEVQSLTCPDGASGGAPTRNVTLACSGQTSGVVRGHCPSMQVVPVCAALGHPGWTCHMVSYEATQTTCNCTFRAHLWSNSTAAARRQVHFTGQKRPLPLNIHNSNKNDDRRLQEGDFHGDDTPTTAPSDSTAHVSFSAVGESVLSDFIATWSSADDISPQDVASGWRVLVTCVCVGGAFVVMVSAAFKVDHDHLQQVQVKQVAEAASISIRNRSSSVSKQSPTPENDGLTGRGVLKEFNRIEESLPVVLQTNSLWVKFKGELKVYHRWFGIIFHYSSKFPRPMRVLTLCTTVMIMLFVEALTYNVADPDDGSCDASSSQAECEAHMSSLAADEPMCYWQPATSATDSSQDGTCAFREIQGDAVRVVTVAIISAIVSTPIALIAHYLILKVLSAETTNSATEAVATLPVASTSVGLVPCKVTYDLQEYIGANVRQDLASLLKAIGDFREALSGEDLEEFDGRSHRLDMCPFCVALFGDVFHCVLLCIMIS